MTNVLLQGAASMFNIPTKYAAERVTVIDYHSTNVRIVRFEFSNEVDQKVVFKGRYLFLFQVFIADRALLQAMRPCPYPPHVL